MLAMNDVSAHRQKTKSCQYVRAWLRGCVAAWLRGVRAWLRGCVAAWRARVRAWLRGCVAAWRARVHARARASCGLTACSAKLAQSFRNRVFV